MSKELCEAANKIFRAPRLTHADRYYLNLLVAVSRDTVYPVVTVD